MGALADPLKKYGIDLITVERPRNIFKRIGIVLSAGHYDGVILHKRLLDGWECALLRRKAKFLLYDVDDAVMFPHDTASPQLQRRTQRRFRSTARAVDEVIAGNQYLKKQFESQGTDCVVVPTVVNPADYQVKKHQHTDTPRLVWIGMSGNLPYLYALRDALAAAKEKVPGLRLVVVCNKTAEDMPLPVDFYPWRLEDESQHLLLGDIGIAPTPENQWTLGKCGFKIVQYMAAGLPVIADPVGANAEIIIGPGTGGVPATGFLPRTTDEWINALITLTGNAQLRQEMGRASRVRVEKHYSLDSIITVWANTILNRISK